jgi:hypothetical protein
MNTANANRFRAVPSTETISGFKADLLAQASETKDKLVGKAKESVTAGARDLWREIKARAAGLRWALGLPGAFCTIRRSRRRLSASALYASGGPIPDTLRPALTSRRAQLNSSRRQRRRQEMPVQICVRAPGRSVPPQRIHRKRC